MGYYDNVKSMAFDLLTGHRNSLLETFSNAIDVQQFIKSLNSENTFEGLILGNKSVAHEILNKSKLVKIRL